MTRLSVNDARCVALFASGLQRSDAPAAEALAEIIRHTVRRLGIAGCASRMAQEFGDHPEAAASRMRWIRQLRLGAGRAEVSRSVPSAGRGWRPAGAGGAAAQHESARRHRGERCDGFPIGVSVEAVQQPHAACSSQVVHRQGHSGQPRPPPREPGLVTEPHDR